MNNNIEKLFSIVELKNDLFNKWLIDEELDEFNNAHIFDEGRLSGVESFLDFIEDEWNKKNDSK